MKNFLATCVSAASMLAFGASAYAAALNTELLGATAGWNWSASSGLLPDEITRPFTLVDSASPEMPVLADGVMTLSTSTASENMYYIISGNSLELPSLLEIDFRMRYVSGSTLQSDRLPVAIPFTVASTVGNVLYIGADRAFLQLGAGSHNVTGFDTDERFHDWSVIVSGRAIGSAISVYYDGSLLMSGETVANSTTLGATPRIAFGEFSVRTTGVSEWQSFAVGPAVSAVPEPSIAMMLALGGVGLGLLRRRSSRQVGDCVKRRRSFA